ncbi:MAG: hypothetical protein HQ453_04530 [Actinobacteria bacterium]|nr:hypothetical protein [Actinomycetota bacterium]
MPEPCNGGHSGAGAGVCDPVTEMPHVWAAVANQVVGAKGFSAKTLSQAVVLNTGGDTRKFTRQDWVRIARLQAVNESEADRDAVGGAPDGKVAGGSVRAVVATCVNDAGSSPITSMTVTCGAGWSVGDDSGWGGWNGAVHWVVSWDEVHVPRRCGECVGRGAESPVAGADY